MNEIRDMIKLPIKDPPLRVASCADCRYLQPAISASFWKCSAHGGAYTTSVNSKGECKRFAAAPKLEEQSPKNSARAVAIEFAFLVVITVLVLLVAVVTLAGCGPDEDCRRTIIWDGGVPPEITVIYVTPDDHEQVELDCDEDTRECTLPCGPKGASMVLDWSCEPGTDGHSNFAPPIDDPLVMPGC